MLSYKTWVLQHQLFRARYQVTWIRETSYDKVIYQVNDFIIWCFSYTRYMTLSYDVSLIPGILLYHMMFFLYQVYDFIIWCFSYTRYITLSYDVFLIAGIWLYHMMFLLYQVYDFIIWCFSYTRYITLSYDVFLIPGILLYHMLFFIYSLDDVISYLVLQEQVNCHNGVYYNNANLHWNK